MDFVDSCRKCSRRFSYTTDDCRNGICKNGYT